MTAEDFYNALSSDYDEMTDSAGRFEKERQRFRQIVERFQIHSALDAGCGTGFHSLVLASLGVTVTAVDISSKMLEQLKRKAGIAHIPVTTIQSNFAELHHLINEPFDAICCLGNTIVHSGTRDDVVKTLTTFHQLLVEDGVLILQLLNYDRILKERKRILSVREKDNKTFVRFYDFQERMLGFNILTLERHGGNVIPTLQTTELLPLRHDELIELITAAGFTSITTYGDLSLKAYEKNNSHDLVVLAR